jgi:hypothetical protein
MYPGGEIPQVEKIRRKKWGDRTTAYIVRLFSSEEFIISAEAEFGAAKVECWVRDRGQNWHRKLLRMEQWQEVALAFQRSAYLYQLIGERREWIAEAKVSGLPPSGGTSLQRMMETS